MNEKERRARPIPRFRPYDEADYVELPGAVMTHRDFKRGPELWHGLQLRSIADMIHLEMRDHRPDAVLGPETVRLPAPRAHE